MGDCGFTQSNLEELEKLMERRACEPPGVDRWCTTYGGDDPCLEACKLVQKYGNGFSFRQLMFSINNRTGSNFTSCFPSFRYGAGAHGLVLRITCSENDTDFTHFAMKITKFETPQGETPYEFHNEVRMQEKFYRLNLAPKILFSDVYYRDRCTHTIGIIVMKPIDSTYDSIINDTEAVLNNSNSSYPVITEARNKRKGYASRISRVVAALTRNNLTHGDMHSQNIAFINGDIKLIDFGRSTDFYSNPILDLAAIAHSDVFMVSALSDEIATSNIPGMARLYDGKFKSILNDHYSCAPPGVPKGSPVGKLLRYKIFISHVLPHFSVLEGVYASMKKIDLEPRGRNKRSR